MDYIYSPYTLYVENTKKGLKSGLCGQMNESHNCIARTCNFFSFSFFFLSRSRKCMCDCTTMNTKCTTPYRKCTFSLHLHSSVVSSSKHCNDRMSLAAIARQSIFFFFFSCSLFSLLSSLFSLLSSLFRERI